MFKLTIIRWQIVPALLAVVCLLPASRAAEGNVIINEIMYHPPFQMDDLQYVELFNRGATEADLSGWSFRRGLKYAFPANTKLAAGAYLVVCRNLEVFRRNYGPDIRAVGDFSGKMSHSGEKLELSDAHGDMVDTIKYKDRKGWATGPDGHGTSLERICPSASGKEAANWAGSLLPLLQKPAGTPGRRNDNYSTTLPPVIDNVVFKPVPSQPLTVTAEVADAGGVKEAVLVWRTARSGGESADQELVMVRIGGDEKQGTYQARVPAQPPATVVRFRLRASNRAGATRWAPSPTEPRPTFSYSTFPNTNTSRIGFAYVLNVSQPRREQQFRVWNHGDFIVPTVQTVGNAVFIYVPPDGGEVQIFDHVYVRPRGGGFKVHFQKDRPFKGMDGINVILEGPPRWVLSEPMAYELYRAAGNPACLTEHVRVWMDGRLVGYQLLIEQPNRSFLRRNERNDTGYMYKLIWMGNGLTGQHEKKTRLATGFDDLIALYKGLTAKTGTDQWEFIRQNFNVEEFINYYAVNMCIQNWDGFFNNYFLYHDSGDTGHWEIYPWDEDKTWGDYDGASPNYDWYTMPLTFGMDGSGPRRGGGLFGGFFGFGGGGASWWRPPGWFSGPLLANPTFRKAFLARLNEICTKVFTEEKMVPLIDAMERRLEQEIPIRAQVIGENPREALAAFHHDIQSLRNQVKYRRQFILQEIPKDAANR